MERWVSMHLTHRHGICANIRFPLPRAPVLTRELIYTAITRARKGIEIRSHEDLFIRAVSRRIERSSGLRETLWDSNKPKARVEAFDSP
jgi:hypothetical protein